MQQHETKDYLRPSWKGQHRHRGGPLGEVSLARWRPELPLCIVSCQIDWRLLKNRLSLEIREYVNRCFPLPVGPCTVCETVLRAVTRLHSNACPSLQCLRAFRTGQKLLARREILCKQQTPHLFQTPRGPKRGPSLNQAKSWWPSSCRTVFAEGRLLLQLPVYGSIFRVTVRPYTAWVELTGRACKEAYGIARGHRHK